MRILIGQSGERVPCEQQLNLGQSVLRDRGKRRSDGRGYGLRLNRPIERESGSDTGDNATDRGEAGGRPRESCLFFMKGSIVSTVSIESTVSMVSQSLRLYSQKCYSLYRLCSLAASYTYRIPSCAPYANISGSQTM
uniref:Uncharacterized protein n=1 Tax=Oncorhynchus mykiss TaxID=8022 RepID=A0A8L0DV50_ONCMY